jgi:hypothetical protein
LAYADRQRGESEGTAVGRRHLGGSRRRGARLRRPARGGAGRRARAHRRGRQRRRRRQLDEAADTLGRAGITSRTPAPSPSRPRARDIPSVDEENDAEEVDDIDADFDAPVDALEALKAKRKKGGKK